MSYENLTLQKDGHVAILTLNRPESLNPLGPAMLVDLEAVLDELVRDDDTRVVIVTGAGRAFSAGGDVKFFARRVGEEQEPLSRTRVYLGRYHEVMRRFTTLDKATIAAVNGVAVGAGMTLALACDIRVASQKARFGELFINVGLNAEGAWTLSRLVGLSKACELMLTGDIIDASEAERIGLVSKVVPATELMPAAMALAQKIAAKPPLAMALTKSIIYKGLDTDLSSSMEQELECTLVCLRTEDHKEAVDAFVEKRQPEFKGR